MNGRGNGLLCRWLAAVGVAVLMAGEAGAKPASRAIPEEISRATPERVAVDGVYPSPFGTILLGHAEVFDGVADLLENLGRNPEAEEPVLRQVTRSARGYEYTIVVPKSKARDEDSPGRGGSGPRPPFFVALPVATALDQWLYPPFVRSHFVHRHSRAQKACGTLTHSEADALADVLESADLRLADYRWERGLIEKRPEGRSSRARRSLGDVARAASSDLSRLFGNLHGLESLRAGSATPPAEMFALLGDLNLIAGRLPAAAESYGIAERLSPGQETLCGHLYDGKLYGAESFSSSFRDGTSRSFGLTGYLLAWDLASGRVVERHLLPAVPEAFAVRQGEIQITLHGGDVARLARRRLAVPVPVSADRGARLSAIWSGTVLAANFAGLETGRSASPFEIRRDFDDRLPLDLPDLEKALRAASLRDPTQPWHPFLLGQALWAQGRRQEAEALWRGIWDGGPPAVPYYELLRMATFYESFGQRGWADLAFGQALERRRRLSRPIGYSHPGERLDNTACVWLAPGLRDPERRYLWWRRVREISGIEPGDAFRAVLWAGDRERRGDRPHARDELAYLERARRDPFDPAAGSAWLDYSLYGVVACAAMLLACLAVLGGRMTRLPMWRRGRPGWGQVALAALRAQGPALLVLSAALYVALSLAVLAASYVGYLMSLPFEPGDVDLAKGQASYEDRFQLTGPDLLNAWLASGVVQPAMATRPPSLLIRNAQTLRGRGAGVRVLLALGALAAMFVLALPAGLLLAWGRARGFVTRWIPGAAQVRSGARLRGYTVFGLFVFAIVPLAWLVVARLWGPVPAPGLVSANRFFRSGLEEPLLPQSPGGFERLCAQSFFRLLAVYPGAGLFWTLVVCALAASVSVHLRSRRVSP